MNILKNKIKKTKIRTSGSKRYGVGDLAIPERHAVYFTVHRFHQTFECCRRAAGTEQKREREKKDRRAAAAAAQIQIYVSRTFS